MRGRRIVFGLVMGAATVSLAARWAGEPSGTKWPLITEPAALRRAATALCREAGGWRELQPAEYPPVIARMLHPASISVSSERIYVALVPVPGGKRFHGYYVWPDTTERPDGGVEREESNGGESEDGP